MRVADVLETCLYVEDLAQAERFYREVLGLEFVTREEGRHIFLRCGRRMLLLFRTEATLSPSSDLPRHGTTGPTHVAFAVPAATLESWKARLAESGVAIEQDHQWPSGVRSLYFRDPAGNSLELTTPRLWGFAEEMDAPRA